MTPLLRYFDGGIAEYEGFPAGNVVTVIGVEEGLAAVVNLKLKRFIISGTLVTRRIAFALRTKQQSITLSSIIKVDPEGQRALFAKY